METTKRTDLHLRRDCQCKETKGQCPNPSTGWARCDSCKSHYHNH